MKSTFSITALMLSPFLKKSVGIWFSFGKMYSFPSSSKMITCLPRMWCTSPTITSPILSLNISYIAALLCSCNFVAKICFNVKIFLRPNCANGISWVNSSPTSNVGSIFFASEISISKSSSSDIWSSTIFLFKNI